MSDKPTNTFTFGGAGSSNLFGGSSNNASGTGTNSGAFSFGSNNGASKPFSFGKDAASAPAGTGAGAGTASTSASKPAFSFGANNGNSGGFGSSTGSNMFGSAGTTAPAKTSSLFATETPKKPADSTTSSSLFGAAAGAGSGTGTQSSGPVSGANKPNGPFGGSGTTFNSRSTENNSSAPNNVFNFGTSNSDKSKPFSFGAGASNTTNDNKDKATAAPESKGLFGSSSSTTAASNGLFGAAAPNNGEKKSDNETKPTLFGSSNAATESKTPLFGASKPAAESKSTTESKPSLFGAPTTTTEQKPSLFGAASASGGSKAPLFGAAPASSGEKPSLFGSSSSTGDKKDNNEKKTGLFSTDSGGDSSKKPMLNLGSNANSTSTNATDKSTTPSFLSKPADDKKPAGLFDSTKKDATDSTATSSVPNASKSSENILKATDLSNPEVANQSVHESVYLKNKSFDDIISKWTSTLNVKSAEFKKQAQDIEQWDRILVENGEKISEIFTKLVKAEQDQSRIDSLLTYVGRQQQDLEQLVLLYEKQADESLFDLAGPDGLQPVDQERQKTYTLAEDLSEKIDNMNSSLLSVVDEINKVSKNLINSKDDDPLTPIIKILNGHLSSLQWIDESSTLLQAKLDEVQLNEARVKHRLDLQSQFRG